MVVGVWPDAASPAPGGTSPVGSREPADVGRLVGRSISSPASVQDSSPPSRTVAARDSLRGCCSMRLLLGWNWAARCMSPLLEWSRSRREADEVRLAGQPPRAREDADSVPEMMPGFRRVPRSPGVGAADAGGPDATVSEVGRFRHNEPSRRNGWRKHADEVGVTSKVVLVWASSMPNWTPLRGAFGILARRSRGRPGRAAIWTLVVSRRTVEWHVANLLAKLGLRSRSQLVLWVAEHGDAHLSENLIGGSRA